MCDRDLTFLSFGRMIRGGGSHRTSSSTSGFRGPGAGGVCPGNPHLGWFSVGVRRLEEECATGLACRDVCSRLLTRSSLRSPGGPEFRSSLLPLVGRSYIGRVAVFRCVRGYGRWRAWRTMVSPTRGTPFPFRPLHARLVWCWPACVWLFVVGSWFLQRFGWCMVVLAALWSACSPLGLSRCSRRWRSRMLSMLSSRLFLGFVAAGPSDVVFRL